jgi:hypothetical protein
MTYRHTQVGWPQRLILLIVAIAMAAIALGRPAGQPVEALLGLAVAAVLLLAVAFWMSMLTVSIDAGRLHWHFGLGFPRHSIALADIERVEIGRTRWWVGWRMRWTPRGWFYSVAGRDIVVIHRRGERPFMLGTDEPERLHAALERAREGRQ